LQQVAARGGERQALDRWQNAAAAPYDPGPKQSDCTVATVLG
jgi:hypothetical protein